VVLKRAGAFTEFKEWYSREQGKTGNNRNSGAIPQCKYKVKN